MRALVLCLPLACAIRVIPAEGGKLMPSGGQLRASVDPSLCAVETAEAEASSDTYRSREELKANAASLVCRASGESVGRVGRRPPSPRTSCGSCYAAIAPDVHTQMHAAGAGHIEAGCRGCQCGPRRLALARAAMRTECARLRRPGSPPSTTSRRGCGSACGASTCTTATIPRTNRALARSRLRCDHHCDQPPPVLPEVLCRLRGSCRAEQSSKGALSASDWGRVAVWAVAMGAVAVVAAMGGGGGRSGGGGCAPSTEQPPFKPPSRRLT